MHGDSFPASTHPCQRIVCVWLPSWPIQRLVVDQPELRRRSVVLFRQDSRRGRLVATASPLAMQLGVGLNMPLAEAKSLLRAATDRVHVLEHDPVIDLKTLNRLADSLESFSPIVGVGSPQKAPKKGTGPNCRNGPQGAAHNWDPSPFSVPDCIFLDITGVSPLFGGEPAWLEQVRQHFEHQGYLPYLAVADTLGMAWGAARYAPGERVLILSGDQQVFRQLPVEALRLAGETISTLRRLGIETIDQLLQLPRPELAMRFGDEIHRRIDQAFGRIKEPLVARQVQPEWMAEQLLDYPTRHRGTIEVIIQRLVTKLCDRLRAQQMGALQWTVSLRTTADAGSGVERSDLPKRTGHQSFEVNLFQATATASEVMPLVEMQLEQLLHPHTRVSRRRHLGRNRGLSSKNHSSGTGTSMRYTTIEVQEIRVRVTSAVRLVEHQRQLFDENPRLDKLELAELINRLTSRLGQSNVVYPRLQAGAQPEFSFRYHPLVDAKRKRKKGSGPNCAKHPAGRSGNWGLTPFSVSHVAGRPLKIFSPALPIQMENEREDQSEWEGGGRKSEGFLLRISGMNSAFQFSNLRSPISHLKIVRHWGPERIETGWWRGQTVCRDYWRIETETGQQLWVYQDLRTGDWFLQGEF